MTKSSKPDKDPLDAMNADIPKIAMPIAEVGEMAIELGGEAFILRPSFECIQRIEAGTGKRVEGIHKCLIHEQEIGANELLVVIAAGIKAGGAEVPDELGERIYQEGFIEMTARAIEFLTNMIVGPKNLKALSATNPKTSPAGGVGEK